MLCGRPRRCIPVDQGRSTLSEVRTRRHFHSSRLKLERGCPQTETHDRLVLWDFHSLQFCLFPKNLLCNRIVSTILSILDILLL